MSKLARFTKLKIHFIVTINTSITSQLHAIFQLYLSLHLLVSCPTMAFCLRSPLSLFFVLLFLQTLGGKAATCNDCFVQSRAAYYPNSEVQGTDGKRLLTSNVTKKKNEQHILRFLINTFPIQLQSVLVGLVRSEQQLTVGMCQQPLTSIAMGLDVVLVTR